MIPAIVAGCVAGAIVSVSFRLFGNRAATRQLRRRLWAHVLELRLFGDEPVLAFASLSGIVKINFLLLARALPPLLAGVPLIALIVLPLSDYFTRTPLQDGEDAVVTVRLHPFAVPQLQTPSWIRVDAPPVSSPAEGEVSWRLRATRADRGLFRIAAGAEIVTGEVDSEPGFHYDGRVRTRAWSDWLLHPDAGRLPAGPIERVWIAPAPTLESWKEWFALAAGLTVWAVQVGQTIAFRGLPSCLGLPIHL